MFGLVLKEDEGIFCIVENIDDYYLTINYEMYIEFFYLDVVFRIVVFLRKDCFDIKCVLEFDL